MTEETISIQGPIEWLLGPDEFHHQLYAAALGNLGDLNNLLRFNNFACVGRIGGGEFVAFLVDTSREPAIAIAERLCESLSQLWSLKGQIIHTSSSLGIAFYPDAGEDVHSLLRHADEALYRAKRAGRSQIKVYEKGTAPNWCADRSSPSKLNDSKPSSADPLAL
jgi:diguanylate cyclase (GGDEF)-like protein